MTAQAWDVVVVGGGPAGCSAAIRLAQRGLRVILFEAKQYPHDKMCGEFLSPEVPGLLKPLGAEEILRSLHPVAIRMARLTAPGGAVWETALPGTALGISRRLLDQALASQARRVGVVVEEGAPISAVEGSLEDGFAVQTRGRNGECTVRARVVIGAHGKRAALDRALGRAFLQADSPYMAIKAHFQGPPVPGRIELHAFPGGYCGMSEIEDGKKVVCLLVNTRVFQKESRSGGPDAFFAWMQRQNPYVSTWLEQAERIHSRWITIAQVPFGPKPAVDRDILMAGDAAGLIVPLAGDGISMALEGGQIAAQWTAAFLDGKIDAAHLRSGYARAWSDQFSGRLRLGRALQPVLLHPKRTAAALRLLSRIPRLGAALIRCTRGRMTTAGRTLDGGKEEMNA